jgi:hypothetical protein
MANNPIAILESKFDQITDSIADNPQGISNTLISQNLEILANLTHTFASDGASDVFTWIGQSAATGTNYAPVVKFATYPDITLLGCSCLYIYNTSATDIEIRRKNNPDQTATSIIKTGDKRLFNGITSPGDLEFRRKDVSNTQITIETETYNTYIP